MIQKVLWERSNSLSQKTVCQNIVETVSRVFSVDVAILLTINPLDRRQYFFSFKSKEILGDLSYNFFKEIALDSENILVIDNVNSDLQWQKKYQSHLTEHKGKIRSMLAVPLTCQYDWKAYLSLYCCQEPRTWRHEDVGLVMMMAAQAGLAISQAHAYEDIKAVAQKEATLNKITAVIRSSLEPQAIYDAIVKELGTALKVDGCALSLWTKEDRYMRCVGLYKSNDERVIPQETRNWQRSTISLVPITENPLLQKLLKDREPVCISDLEQDRGLARFDLPWRSQSRAILIVPLILDNEIMGSITLRETHKYRKWRRSEVELARAVASHAAIAVKQAIHYETTRTQAIQLQVSENRVKELNNYLTESILKRFLPEIIVNKAARGRLTLDLNPEPHVVTVLFCDLVGFTKLSGQLEVDVLSELLNEYLEAMTQAIFDCSGTVDKFLGDGIMALFGAPEELSVIQQAQRAIATAKSMYRYLITINQKWRTKQVWQAENIADLQLRCGIHQGRAVVGMFGGKHRKDYTAIGKVVNIAARLQQNAEPNSILLSETVFNCLENQSDIKVEPKLVQLKGIEPNFQSYLLSVDIEALIDG